MILIKSPKNQIRLKYDMTKDSSDVDYVFNNRALEVLASKYRKVSDFDYFATWFRFRVSKIFAGRMKEKLILVGLKEIVDDTNTSVKHNLRRSCVTS